MAESEISDLGSVIRGLKVRSPMIKSVSDYHAMRKKPIADTTLIYTRIVERYAPFFDRPEVRLRFLNNTLAKQATRRRQLHIWLRRFAFIERTRLYQKLLELGLYRLIFEELNRMLPAAPEERRRLLARVKAPVSARLFFRVYQLRYLFYGAGLAAALVALLLLYSAVMWSAQRVNNYLAERYQKSGRGPAAGPSTALSAETAKFLPDYRPEKVWLVEQKENSERYSNGGRILTDYQTENHPRGYYVFLRDGAPFTDRVHEEPVGIIYHTSEGDLLPFTADNNSSILKRTQNLLEYVQRNKSYHYVIDRFGQIYRIVRDDHAANHAGNSVWADRQNVYVGLNESFLGVCFETKSEVGSLDEQLTEAQLIAGRALTGVLRSRYNLDDANCVTHGLVSVNPGKMLIASHHDWVRNFPFEAMGLSDKYKVAPASISEYGFTYDDYILAKLDGQIWPGALEAEEEFKRRAAQAKVSVEDLRQHLRSRYREQLELTRKLRASTSAETEKLRADARSSLAAHPSERRAEGK
jgi:hypothetical protein